MDQILEVSLWADVGNVLAGVTMILLVAICTYVVTKMVPGYAKYLKTLVAIVRTTREGVLTWVDEPDDPLINLLNKLAQELIGGDHRAELSEAGVAYVNRFFDLLEQVYGKEALGPGVHVRVRRPKVTK